MNGQALANMFVGWLTRKSYETSGKIAFDQAVKTHASQLAPGGIEFARARYRELLNLGWTSGRAAQQAVDEAYQRFPQQ